MKESGLASLHKCVKDRQTHQGRTPVCKTEKYCVFKNQGAFSD